jgi:hypothetical protein
MLRQHHCLPNLAAGLLTCLCTLSLSLPGAAGELSVQTTNIAGTDGPPAVTPALEEALRQLKEQQASTFQALELIRHQTETALYQNASVLSNQLAQFSTALAGNSKLQLQFMRDTERRTLQVTLLILVAVLLGVGGVVFVAARTFRALARRLPFPAPAPGQAEVSADRVESSGALLEKTAASAYTAALLEVETRIAALERRPTQGLAAGPAAATPARRNPPAAARPTAPAKPGPSTSLAVALGDGQAIVFLPRERGPGAGGRIGEFLHRFSRLFSHKKTSTPAKPLPGPRPLKC